MLRLKQNAPPESSMWPDFNWGGQVDADRTAAHELLNISPALVKISVMQGAEDGRNRIVARIHSPTCIAYTIASKYFLYSCLMWSFDVRKVT